jgi:hypothetical protein
LVVTCAAQQGKEEQQEGEGPEEEQQEGEGPGSSSGRDW